MSWIRMADTLKTHFHNNLYYKTIVVTDVVLKYFVEYVTTSFAKYQQAPYGVRVDTRDAF